MNNAKLSIATIALARNEQEEQTLRQSLEALATLAIPVFVTDGGSSASFVSFLNSLPHFHVFSAKGLWPQAKKSLTEAAGSGAKAIFYTEPDKLHFFQQHLPAMLAEKEITETTGVILASRSASGYASFPQFQQMTEQTINQCCREVIGTDADYCYGPFLFSSQLVPALAFLPENIGWGWRPALFATAHRKGLVVDSFTGDFFCPPDQQVDDAKERIYRMKQLTQNIKGLVLTTSVQM